MQFPVQVILQGSLLSCVKLILDQFQHPFKKKKSLNIFRSISALILSAASQHT